MPLMDGPRPRLGETPSKEPHGPSHRPKLIPAQAMCKFVERGDDAEFAAERDRVRSRAVVTRTRATAVDDAEFEFRRLAVGAAKVCMKGNELRLTLILAAAPWFGSCESLDRLDYGWPELHGRIQDFGDRGGIIGLVLHVTHSIH